MAEVTGYCLNWIHILVRRYNQRAPQALLDHRHTDPGAAAILSAERQVHLEQVLESPPPDGGLWTGRQVAQWIEAHVGRKIRPPWGWEYLKRLGYSKHMLRPRHAIADPAAQEAFKKTFQSR